MNVKVKCRIALGIALLVALAGCSRNDKAAIGSIGEITGTISWPVTSLNAGVVQITPWMGGKPITAPVTLSQPFNQGNRTLVTYQIKNLPVGTQMRLVVLPGNFERDSDPQFAECSLQQPTVSGFDYHWVPAP